MPPKVATAFDALTVSPQLTTKTVTTELQDKSSFDASLVSGLLSGSVSRAAKEIVLHPIDTIKVFKLKLLL